MRAQRRKEAPVQQEMNLPTWGGKRKNAGRKPRRGRRLVAHRSRGAFNHRRPLHVTIRMADGVYNLRGNKAQVVVGRMLLGGAGKFGVSVVQLSVQGNHIHLLIEAPDHVSMGRALKGMAVRLARGMNKLMGRAGGRVVGDRYHAHLLRTPTEVRHAIHYIRHNFRKHEAQCGRVLPVSFIDPCSSDRELAQCVVRASVWLLTTGLRGPPPNALRAATEG
jgi:putative transposase